MLGRKHEGCLYKLRPRSLGQPQRQLPLPLAPPHGSHRRPHEEGRLFRCDVLCVFRNKTDHDRSNQINMMKNKAPNVIRDSQNECRSRGYAVSSFAVSDARPRCKVQRLLRTRARDADMAPGLRSKACFWQL